VVLVCGRWSIETERDAFLIKLFFDIPGCRLSLVQGDGERESFAGGTRKVV
jgi:hypothetical protein